MDRKSVIVLLISAVLLVWWFKSMQRYARRPNAGTNVVATATNQLSATNKTVAAAVGTNKVAAVETNTPEQLLTYTNENAIYTFSSHGGGLKEVALRHFPETIACGREVPGERRLATLNTKAPLPAFAFSSGDLMTQGNAVYELSDITNGVRAQRSIGQNLVLIKDFQFGTNYMINVKTRIENRGAAAAKLDAYELTIGTATPMGPHDQGMDVGIFWYNGSKDEHVNQSWFANRTLGCLPGTPRTVYENGQSNVFWAAVQNQFFTMATVPSKPAQRVVSRQVDLPPPSAQEITNDSRVVRKPVGYLTSLAYPASTISANSAIEQDYTVYIGPREYNTLARLGDQMKNDLDAVMGFQTRFGGRVSGFFARALLLSMNGLHKLGIGYGLAIIAITVIIKLLLWPLTAASTRSMKRMQALQPQMNALREKYKDDPTKMNMKLMEFMREHKVSPLGGCLPMLIQFPIFIGFYSMLQSAIELRGVSFLWACDLSQADTIARLGAFPINPLPMIMGVTMLWQSHMTPAAPGADPAQQKIMRYMPLIFLFMLYNMSAGLTLYWTVQNLLTIAQMKLTKNIGEPSAQTAPSTPKKKK